MKLLIYGIVQGVGFRPAVYRVARSLGLKGYVRNNGSNVEIVVNRNHEKFMAKLRGGLPPLARIDRVEMHRDDRKREAYSEFIIVRSSGGRASVKNPSIPPDTALCGDCIGEVLRPLDRRYLYPFTNCTNCGARFSVISALPYDRENTSMEPFKLCAECRREYKDPENRRFHAQTISCPGDGPKYGLFDSKKQPVKADEPIKKFAQFIDEGKIGVAKGWGGMHIICSLKQVGRLRRWYGRPQKPFAIMVRDIETARKYAEVDSDAEKLLVSPERPILLVCKKERGTSKNTIEAVSPGLGSIGVYLPYSGLHYILFRHLRCDAIISTSANPKGEPMLTRNSDAFSLGLDCYLLHNREIVNRVDDSVVIPYGGRAFFIRRSRGYIPQALEIGHQRSVVCFGAQENVTSSVSRNGSLYISQYIGDTTHYNVMRFLDSATGHLARLVGAGSISAVGTDLHPQYPSRALAKEWSERHNAKLVEVQHHWAHAASLLLDNRTSGPIVALTLDGAGYGPDGTVWGGEVLVADYKKFERVGTLERFPLIGGDAAVRDPRRLVFALHEMLGTDPPFFDEKTAQVLEKLGKKSIRTSSMGRVLDALSCRLGVCLSMTYDGEPAMKLERYLSPPGDARSRNEFATDISSSGDLKTVRILPLFEELEDLLKRKDAASGKTKNAIAHYFVNEIIKNLVEIASDEADKRGIGQIGLTGGVSYNLPITRMVVDFVRARGLIPVLHSRVPNGDGGISAGQNAVVGNLI
jgi:hydrogenase maturation protein HypF